MGIFNTIRKIKGVSMPSKSKRDISNMKKTLIVIVIVIITLSLILILIKMIN